MQSACAYYNIYGHHVDYSCAAEGGGGAKRLWDRNNLAACALTAGRLNHLCWLRVLGRKLLRALLHALSRICNLPPEGNNGANVLAQRAWLLEKHSWVILGGRTRQCMCAGSGTKEQEVGGSLKALGLGANVKRYKHRQRCFQHFRVQLNNQRKLRDLQRWCAA